MASFTAKVNGVCKRFYAGFTGLLSKRARDILDGPIQPPTKANLDRLADETDALTNELRSLRDHLRPVPAPAAVATRYRRALDAQEQVLTTFDQATTRLRAGDLVGFADALVDRVGASESVMNARFDALGLRACGSQAGK